MDNSITRETQQRKETSRLRAWDRSQKHESNAAYQGLVRK